MIKVNRQIDLKKAKSLLDSARVTFKRLNETNKQKYPSNSLIDYHDIIRRLMEGISSTDGIKFIKESAHYDLINHVCEKCQLSSFENNFLQQLREYRNRISYEGFNVNKNYIKDNEELLNNIIYRLEKILNNRLK